MNIGDRISGATLVAKIAADRWKGTLQDGTVVEIRTGSVSRWDALGEAVSVPVIYERTATAVLHAPVDDRTLAALASPLPASAVAFVGIRIATALAGGTGLSALSAADVGLDLAGHPVLAPGPATESLAPEGGLGRDAALYDLGAMLYRLATGTLPSAQPPVPPSKRQPGLPAGLDDAILGLLSSNPSDRAPAVRAMVSLAEPMDLRTYVGKSGRYERATMEAGTVKLTTTSSRRTSASADIRAPAAAIIVAADVLAELPPAALSHLAGVVELPLSAIKESARAGRPLVVEALPHRGGASSASIAMQRELEMPLAAAVGPGFSRLAEILFFAFCSGGLALAALVLGSGGLGLAAVVATILVAVSIFGGIRESRALAAAVDAYMAQEKARTTVPEWSPRIAEQRRRLASVDLPGPVERDARDALDGLEAPHVTLAEVERGLTALQGILADGLPHGEAAEAAERTADLARRARIETSQ